MGIVRAELQIGNEGRTQAISEQDTVARFRLELAAGKYSVQTWLVDGDGQREFGAYYTSFCRL